ncbi:MAG: FAD/NAD(P)-binding oxidoreductase [Sumerlaeia bacterium]
MSTTHDVTYLLVGGGIACERAAESIREEDQEGAVLLVCKEDELPYSRPPLSKKYMRGHSRDHDIVRFKPLEFYETHNIQFVLGTSVTAMNLAGKTAILSDGTRVNYDKALVATGGRAKPFPGPGATLEGVFTLRSVKDSEHIRDFAHREGARRAVIVGGAYIGCEIAHSLAEHDISTSVISNKDQVHPKFLRKELAHRVAAHMESQGTRVITGEKVTSLEGNGRVSRVITDRGREIPADMVVVAIGIEPNTELLEQAGLVADNGFQVDEFMRSVDNPDLFIAGDIANWYDPLFDTRRRVEHWGTADELGCAAGRNMARAVLNRDLEPHNHLTYIWSDLFGLHFDMAGNHKKYDEVVTAGDMEALRCLDLYFQEGRLMAYLGINWDDEDFKPLQEAIRNRAHFPPEERLAFGAETSSVRDRIVQHSANR